MSANLSVKEAMSSNLRSVDPELPVIEAARIMLAEDIGSLPVGQGDRLIGVLTDRDIAVRVVAEGKDPTDLPVAGVATRELVTVSPEQPLDEALQLMASAQVRRLPVVDDGRLVGILAQADVARTADEQATGRVVGEIPSRVRSDTSYRGDEHRERSGRRPGAGCSRAGNGVAGLVRRAGADDGLRAALGPSTTASGRWRRSSRRAA